jgi:hypothetical protein
VRRLHAHYDNLVWMKLSEIARYWAARELTRIEPEPAGTDNSAAATTKTLALRAPFPCPNFTLSVPAAPNSVPVLTSDGQTVAPPLRAVSRPLELVSGTWTRDGDNVVVCFDLSKGVTRLCLSNNAG